ncbi:hypothetical protein [Tateyamaria sp.]|uniref:hypothetical protein n=1 Tax=Tateyamaria sp. TaxID=1929288 RepID=UPI00329BCEC7
MLKRDTSTRDENSEGVSPPPKRKVLLGEESPIVAPPVAEMDLSPAQANTFDILEIDPSSGSQDEDSSTTPNTEKPSTPTGSFASDSEDDDLTLTPTGSPVSSGQEVEGPSAGHQSSADLNPLFGQGDPPPKFTSKYETTQESEADLIEYWETKHDDFYDQIHKLLEIARDSTNSGFEDARKTLGDLIAGYKLYPALKKKIDAAVRVKAEQRPKMSSGTGLDEFLRTSETMTFLEWSFDPPTGKSATSIVDGQEVDWMDAQRSVRASTDMIIWASAQVDTISAHTGSLHKERRGAWATSGQAAMHTVRDNAIKQRNHPAGAMSTAIAAHLIITEALFEGEIWEETVGNEKFILPNGHLIIKSLDIVRTEIQRTRDKLKEYRDLLEDETELPLNASPVRKHPTSPHQGIGSPIQRGEGNELFDAKLGVETRVRWDNFGEPVPIPSKRHPLYEELLSIDRSFYKKIQRRYGAERSKFGPAKSAAANAFDNNMDENLLEAAKHVLGRFNGDDPLIVSLRQAVTDFEASPH